MVKMKVTCIVVCSFLMIYSIEAVNILHLAFTPSPSHNIWEKTISMALRDKGYNITYVTPVKEKTIENFTVIHIEGAFDKQYEEFDFGELAVPSTYENVKLLFQWLESVCVNNYNSNGIKQLLEHSKSGIKYDLIMYDITTAHCFLPFIEKFGSPPAVATSPFGILFYFASSFGFDIDASHIPLYTISYTNEMTFFQRMNNYFFTMLSLAWYQYSYLPKVWTIAEKVFGPNIPHYTEFEKHFSFLLANYDPTLDYPRSLPPAVIPVGGLHVRRKSSLPKDIEEILNNAKEGVILFSLGTNVRSELLNKAKIKILLDAFSQLNQTVIWKYESELKNLPKNVIIRPWLSQSSILNHTNLKLFISHGGGLSTQEAMYYGVPVIGIPFYADQHVNMFKIVQRKSGIKLDFQTLTTTEIKNAVEEIVSNPMYKKNMENISKLYRDQPQDALERALFWVEYTIKHGGAQHLRIAPRDMPFFQTYYLDIWAFILTILLILFYAIKKTFSLLFGSKRSEKLKSN